MADNRVVIKINYDKDKYRKALIDPKMVTVWHTRRIISALIMLLLIVGGAVFWFFRDSPVNEAEQTSGQVQATAVPVPALPVGDAKTVAESSEIVANGDTSQQSSEVPSSSGDVPAVRSADSKRSPAIIFDRRVIRASLNTAPKNGEPGDAVSSPVIIENNQTIELFYFSQIKGLIKESLFHKWYKDGNLMLKKPFTVKSNNEKLISSKKLTANGTGEWQVLLVDKNDKVLSEVNFTVKH